VALKAVGFDLDGTLYPGWVLYLRSLDLGLRNPRLLAAYGKARLALREKSTAAVDLEAFRAKQADLVARYMGSGEGPDYAKAIETIIYGKVESRFSAIKPFRGVTECLASLKNAGLRLGLLSDLPPWRKLEYLGCAEAFDVIHCSEDSGALKPHPASFLKLAQSLGVNPAEMAYVGNKVEYDIEGARNLGMKTALRTKRAFADADFFAFSDWKKLETWLLSQK
jgi:putative hydrolase of the HAD superfamily